MVYNHVMLTYLLILINVLVFLMIRANRLDANKMAMSYYSVSVCREYYRLLTSAFAHEDLYHFLTNMISLYNIGTVCEDAFGSFRMLAIYFISMLAGKYLSILIRHSNHDDYTLSLGASGAISGLFGAYLMLIMYYYGLESLSYFIRPIVSMILISILPGVDGTSHICCLSIGMLTAYLMILL
jgi:membrane associated rhomboid family serine protease